MRVACTGIQSPDGSARHLGITHPGTMRVASIFSASTGEHVAIAVHVAGMNMTVMNADLGPTATHASLKLRGCSTVSRAGDPAVLCG